ncbi:MAG: hypothetical protein ABJM36_04235 [Algibacter sp.]|uniref:hypothetical protein n=1 Tax=Algibacter sp. TaxID=1872428 RepID=UPI0032972E04
MLLNCDGRKTKQDALKTSIIKFKDSIETIEIIEYIPKKYSEIKTDTILSNGFTVKVSSITDMDNSILKSFQKDSASIKQYHRKRIVTLEISLNGKLLFDKQIDTLFLKSYKGLAKSIISKDLIISDLRIDPKTSLSPKTELYMFITAYNPGDKFDKRFQLHFDKSGNYRLNTTGSYPI